MGVGMRKLLAAFVKSREGFTLLEVMIALSILAVGLLGVIGMFSTSSGGNAQGRNMTQASVLAQSELDRLTNIVAYRNLVLGTSATETGLQPDSSSGVKFSRNYTITAPVAALDMKMITVRVTWVTKGETHKVEMTSVRNTD